MAWKKREKRIVSLQKEVLVEVIPKVEVGEFSIDPNLKGRETVSAIPSLKKALIHSETNFERAGGGEVLLPKVCGKNAAEVAIAKNNTSLKDEEAERAEIRRKAGLTYEQLCETVAKGLMAMVCNAETGEPICPANSERAKFVAAAIDLLGAKRAESAAQRLPTFIINRANFTVEKI